MIEVSLSSENEYSDEMNDELNPDTQELSWEVSAALEDDIRNNFLDDPIWEDSDDKPDKKRKIG